MRMRASTTKTMRSRADNQLPNPDAGECDRCRLVFEDNGQVLLNVRERCRLTETEILDIGASYELEIVEGSRAAYDAGREIRLMYSPKALDERRETLQNFLAAEWRPILARQLPADSSTSFDMKCVVEPMPQSSIVATPSSLLIEDKGAVKAVITARASRQ